MRRIKMFRIKKRERCMACLSEESATRARPATIKVKMDSGEVSLCGEHFKSYCRVVIDEDRQGAILH